MLQRIREYVRVAVIHGPQQNEACMVRLAAAEARGQGSHYHWRHRTGDDLLLHYSVTDGTALYELIYNSSQQIWVLESV